MLIGIGFLLGWGSVKGNALLLDRVIDANFVNRLKTQIVLFKRVHLMVCELHNKLKNKIK